MLKMSRQRMNCAWCGQEIATTHKYVHFRACKQRLYKASIDTLSYGEAKEAGRLEEFIKLAKDE